MAVAVTSVTTARTAIPVAMTTVAVSMTAVTATALGELLQLHINIFVVSQAQGLFRKLDRGCCELCDQ